VSQMETTNKRSGAALERIGGKFEGILRAHRLAADRSARDSMRYSMPAGEWPAIKRGLSQRLDQT
jgi:N-acetyltransferase